MMMSGLEWGIVTVVGVLLIFGFVILEMLFPATGQSQENEMARRQSVPRHAGPGPVI